MVCKICGDLRVLTDANEFKCPKCEKMRIIASSSVISKCMDKKTKIETKIRNSLENLPKQELLSSLLEEREIMAQNFRTNIGKPEDAIDFWASINFLIDLTLSAQDKDLKDTVSKETYDLLSSLALQLLDAERIIYQVKSRYITFLEEDPDKPVKTEKYPFTEPSLLQSGESSEIEFDRALVNYSFFDTFQEMVSSEKVIRFLKIRYPKRLFPFITPDNSDKTYFMIDLLVSTCLTAEPADPVDSEEVLWVESDRDEIERLLKTKYSDDDVKWFLDHFINNPARLSIPLFVKSGNDGNILVPIPTLRLVQDLLYKHLKIPKKGRDSNAKGEIVEYSIFSVMRMSNLETNHPITGNDLLRVMHPEKFNEEIADVMGFDATTVVSVESKYWDAIDWESLERELEKFKMKCEYIEKNLDKFGISPGKNLERLFFTPFAPVTVWNDITIIPSLASLGEHISQKFGYKKKSFELIKEDRGWTKILNDNKSKLQPFSQDLHELDPGFTLGKFKIQDCIFQGFREDMNDVLLLAPLDTGAFIPIGCEITPELNKKLIDEKKKKDDVIKVILADLFGEYTAIQLVDYVSVNFEKLIFEIMEYFKDNMLVTQIFDVFKKLKLDFNKVVSCIKKKGQSIHQGIGYVLAMGDMSDSTVIQCDCGEILWFKNDIVDEIRKAFNGHVECKRCDPNHFQKIINAQGGGAVIQTTMRMSDTGIKQAKFNDFKSIPIEVGTKVYINKNKDSEGLEIEKKPKDNESK